MGKKKSTEIVKPAHDPSYRRQFGNYPAKKYAKGTPAQIRLEFEFEGGATQFIDISMALSSINRRMARQGCYYYINSVELYNNEDAFVDIHTLPDTWVTRSAYRRAKGIFDKMNQLVLENNVTLVPKYHDFKVYMNNLHRLTGSANPSLHYINAAATAYAPDEWAYSQIVSADDDGDAIQQADNFYLHMLGAHAGAASNWESVGVIRSYADTRVEPDTSGSPVLPSTVAADPLLNVFDYSSEEQFNDIVTRLDEDNDETPYDANSYVGELSGSMQHVGRLVTTATLGRKDQIDGFCAPCGLICVDPQATATAYRIVINLAPGTYHGVYAERMV